MSHAPMPRQMRFSFALLITAILVSLVTRANAQTTQPAASAPSPEQRMDRLLTSGPPEHAPASRSNERTTDASTGKAAVAPDAPLLPVVREGTHLINRTGRLNHSSDGQTATFTFDSDGKTMADPPMIILPNLKLQSMEAAVVTKASDVHFRVSGSVTEYKGRNYILLDKAVVMADVEQQF